MAYVRLTAARFSFDSKKAAIAYRQVFKDAVALALLAFARSGVRLTPVESGMAAAAFTSPPGEGISDIADDGFDRLYASIDSRIQPGPYSKYRDGSTKSKSRGMALGDYSIRYTATGVSVEFTSEVWHFNLNEFNKISSVKGSPWHVIARSRIMFYTTLRKEIDKRLKDDFLKQFIYYSGQPSLGRRGARPIGSAVGTTRTGFDTIKAHTKLITKLSYKLSIEELDRTL